MRQQPKNVGDSITVVDKWLFNTKTMGFPWPVAFAIRSDQNCYRWSSSNSGDDGGGSGRMVQHCNRHVKHSIKYFRHKRRNIRSDLATKFGVETSKWLLAHACTQFRHIHTNIHSKIKSNWCVSIWCLFPQIYQLFANQFKPQILAPTISQKYLLKF